LKLREFVHRGVMQTVLAFRRRWRFDASATAGHLLIEGCLSWSKRCIEKPVGCRTGVARSAQQSKECTTDRQAYDPHVAGEVTSHLAEAQSTGEKSGGAEGNEARARSQPKAAQRRAEVA
jgi:hypothetical protein